MALSRGAPTQLDWSQVHPRLQSGTILPLLVESLGTECEIGSCGHLRQLGLPCAALDCPEGVRGAPNCLIMYDSKTGVEERWHRRVMALRHVLPVPLEHTYLYGWVLEAVALAP